MAAVTITDLTESTVDGAGVFDKLMQAASAHLEQEFTKQRIKGPEYATVYLTGLQTSMDQAIRFLLERENTALIEAQVRLAEQQILKLVKEIDLVDAQIRQMEAQADVTEQQILNLQCEEAKCQAEILNIPKQGLILDQQLTNLIGEDARTDAQTAQIAAQTAQTAAETLNVPKQGALLDQQVINLVSEELGINAKTALTTQQTANAVIEGTVLVATECKVRAEFDVLMENKAKIAIEAALLAQKKITEQAQTQGGAFDGNSVIGKQTALYSAQTSGFARDAEQKVLAQMVKAFGVMATTVDGYTGDGSNGFSPGNLQSAVNKALAGI